MPLPYLCPWFLTVQVISVTTTGLELMHKVIAAWPETKPWLKESDVDKIKDLVRRVFQAAAALCWLPTCVTRSSA